MPTLLDFRRRIRSVKNTQQITRAMKFVAAARLRRAQEAALAARPYAKELVRVLRSTISRIAEPQHPLLSRRPEERVLEFSRANKSRKLSVIPVGKKGRDSLRKAGFNLIGEYVNVLARVEFGTVREISNLVTDLYAKGEIDSVYIIFSEFKTVMSANLTVEKLLPVDPAQVVEGSEGASASGQVDYIYEQPEEQLLDRLLPRYVESQVQRAMLESSAAEHAARMTAMESATKNAGDVIEALTLHMNKVRQAAITKEIIEIVSGATSTA